MSYAVEIGVIRTYIWYWKSLGLNDIPRRVSIDSEESEDWAWALQIL